MSQPFHERRNKDRELNKLDDIVTNNSTQQDTREIALILKGVGEDMSDTAAAIGKAVAQMKITEERLSRSMEEVVKQLTEHQRQDDMRIASQVSVEEYRQKVAKRNLWMFGLFWGIFSASSLCVSGWESGLGHLDINGKLVRTTVYSSSVGDAKVNFGSGAKDIIIALSAHYINDLADRLHAITVRLNSAGI